MVRPLIRLAARESTALAFFAAAPLPRPVLTSGSAASSPWVTSCPSASGVGLGGVDRSRTPARWAPAPLLRSAMADDLLDERIVRHRPGRPGGVGQDRRPARGRLFEPGAERDRRLE